MARDDPLLSVSKVARMWGTGLDVVVSLVNEEVLPSLDRGELVRQGHMDVPVIRRSWAEFLRRDSDGSSRVLDPPEGERLHPAARVAFEVHSALDRRDAQGLYELSSKASRAGRNPDALLERWLEICEGGFPTDSGVGSTIYSLAPLSAVAARVFASAPKIPRAVSKATPAQLLAVLPFVHEDGEWRVDLPMFDGSESTVYLPELITTPMPGKDQASAAPDERPAPPQSQPPTT